MEKKQIEQYTGIDMLDPINSLAPIGKIRIALNDMKKAASNSSQLSKVWLQLSFDSAQWQYDVSSASKWNTLHNATLSRKSRTTPLYAAIKARVENKDGTGEHICYSYNKELQSPVLKYYNTADKSYNVILYEDSNSTAAKINLSKEYGLGGISIWSLGNVPNYTDSVGVKYHLDLWSTILEEMDSFHVLSTEQTQTVTFIDPVVEQAVRKKLGNKTGKLTIADMKSIYRLKIPTGCKSLKDLKKLTNLEYLYAGNLNIKDITSLASLTNLQVLYLPKNGISDIAPLMKLTKLEILDLSNNVIQKIDGIKNLKKLKTLYLQRNNISNMKALEGMSKLTTLSLNGNKIVDVSALKKLTSLERLYLKENRLTNITSLKGLTNLKELYLSGNTIKEYSVIQKLYNKKGFLCDFKI